MDDDYELIFKVVLIGDSGVGKSNLLSRYLKDQFFSDSKATVGVEFGAKKVEISGVKIKAQIWDTAGQERYRSIASAYYKGTKGALLVFDITKRKSFENIDTWVQELKAIVEPNVTIILIGNKCDLEEREVSAMEAEGKARTYGMAYMETSAKIKVNIDNAFFTLVNEIYKKYEKLAANNDNDFILTTNEKGIDISQEYKKAVSNRSFSDKVKNCCDNA